MLVGLVSVVLDGTLTVTLLCRCVVPLTAKVPMRKVTTAPPALLAGAMALSIAGAASVFPSAFAPNDVTLKVFGAWVAALAIIGVANAARPTSPAAENPMSFVLLRTQALLPLSRTCRDRYGRGAGNRNVSEVGVRLPTRANQPIVPRCGMKTMALDVKRTAALVAALGR